MSDQKYDDLDDLNMDDIAGEVQCQKADKKETKSSSVDEAVSFLKDGKSDKPSKETKSALEAACEKAWICITRGSKVYIRELAECTPEEFKLWVEQMYPVVDSKKHKASDYEKLDARRKAHTYILAFHNNMKFPPLEEITPKAKKKEEKKKDEKKKK